MYLLDNIADSADCGGLITAIDSGHLVPCSPRKPLGPMFPTTSKYMAVPVLGNKLLGNTRASGSLMAFPY